VGVVVDVVDFEPGALVGRSDAQAERAACTVGFEVSDVLGSVVPVEPDELVDPDADLPPPNETP
jgi:hypothetical protein